MKEEGSERKNGRNKRWKREAKLEKEEKRMALI